MEIELKNNKLFIEDICSRLPYNLKLKTDKGWCFTPRTVHIQPYFVGNNISHYDFQVEVTEGIILDITDCKPYLYPLTKEVYEKASEKTDEALGLVLSREWISDINEQPQIDGKEILTLKAEMYSSFMKYCYQNHIDIHGFINKGLALDATGMNVY